VKVIPENFNIVPSVRPSVCLFTRPFECRKVRAAVTHSYCVDTAAGKTRGQRSFLPSVRRPIGNESALKIMVNNIINLLFLTAISILAISNHNSFPALFDQKIASVYFI